METYYSSKYYNTEISTDKEEAIVGALELMASRADARKDFIDNFGDKFIEWFYSGDDWEIHNDEPDDDDDYGERIDIAYENAVDWELTHRPLNDFDWKGEE